MDLAEVAKKHRLRLILQYGSTVSGRLHRRSDLDIAVLFEHGAVQNVLNALQDDLTSALGGGRTVDIAVLNLLNPLFLLQVSDGHRLLWGEASELFRFRLYAFRCHAGYARYFALERDFVHRALP